MVDDSVGGSGGIDPSLGFVGPSGGVSDVSDESMFVFFSFFGLAESEVSVLRQGDGDQFDGHLLEAVPVSPPNSVGGFVEAGGAAFGSIDF